MRNEQIRASGGRHTQSPDICIIGASVRAAAHSALRAGLRPYCADLFADRDLRGVADCQRISRAEYPERFGQFLDASPHGPWMYAGGLENYPDLLNDWAKTRFLHGNHESELASVRDPVRLAELLSRNDLLFPQIISARSASKELNDTQLLALRAATDLTWLVKPMRSAGGHGIRFWPSEDLPSGVYLQEFITGQSVSAIFVCSPSASWFIGATRQLVGESWLNAPPFHYCGSIGPLPEDETDKTWRRIGMALGDAGLRGIVGVDAIVKDNQLLVIEVNPRYTASVEVLELAERISILEVHAFEFGHITQPLYPLDRQKRLVGKGIYFAPFTFEFPGQGLWEADLDAPFDPWRTPNFADIPVAGTVFSPGDPVISVLVDGDTIGECETKLRERSAALSRLMQ